jgi:hypothetical protein
MILACTCPGCRLAGMSLGNGSAWASAGRGWASGGSISWAASGGNASVSSQPPPSPFRSLAFAARSPAPRPGRSGIDGFDGVRQEEFRQEEAGLAMGSVRGLRQWRFPVKAALQSALLGNHVPAVSALIPPLNAPPLLVGVQGRPWKPGINEAECLNHEDHAPPVEFDAARGVQCGCGHWGYWGMAGQSWIDDHRVMGIIEGTGRVLIGEKGFRCQRARIIALMPAFTIEPHVSADWDYGYPRQSAPDPLLAEAARLRRDKELTQARDRAHAWMGVIMEALGELYPEARIFATLPGMLAAIPLGEITP